MLEDEINSNLNASIAATAKSDQTSFFFFFLAAPQFFQCSFYLLLYDYIGGCKSPLEAKFSVQNKKQSRLSKPAGVEHDLAFCAITEKRNDHESSYDVVDDDPAA